MTLPVTLSPDPLQDGKTHINIWSRGRTELGQYLSNFAHVGFNHPVHGYFASMEGYWYWCSSGRRHDELRRLYGVSAKTVGSKLEIAMIPESEFQEMIREGLRCKIMQNPDLAQALKESTLPLEHYFVYGHNVIVNQAIKHGWQLEYLSRLRHELQGGPTADQAVEMVELHDGTWKAVQELNVGDILKAIPDVHYTPLTADGPHFSTGSHFTGGVQVHHNVKPEGQSFKQWSDDLSKQLLAGGLTPTGDSGGINFHHDGSVDVWGTTKL